MQALEMARATPGDGKGGPPNIEQLGGAFENLTNTKICEPHRTAPAWQPVGQVAAIVVARLHRRKWRHH